MEFFCPKLKEDKSNKDEVYKCYSDFTSKCCINAMDYCEEKWYKDTGGTSRKLFKYQWDKIHLITK
jgi:hypothetical protein